MSYKDILTPVIGLEEDEAALAATASLATIFEARATALIVGVQLASAFVDRERPLSEVLLDLTQGSQSHAAQLRRDLVAWIERSRLEFEVRDLSIEGAVNSDQIAAHARASDLIVMARASAHVRARQALLEDVLFRSGRPMVLAPERPVQCRSWDRIVIGWNAKAEAVRAIIGALPLLRRAKRVVVATVDARPSPAGHSSAPGHEIAAHLARHGVRAEVHNIDGLGRTEGRALLDDAVAIDADLIVLGAYGHSQTREFFLGGVTREMLVSSSIPLLMAH